MDYMTLDEIISGMNNNKKRSNINASKKELKKRGYSAIWDTYREIWYLA